MEVRVLSRADVRRSVGMPEAIEAVADAFARLSAGEAEVPLRIPLETDAGVTLFMPAALSEASSVEGDRPSGPAGGGTGSGAAGALGAKVVSVFPRNREWGLPTIHAAVLLVDTATGAPRALLDGTWLTALRTGAATGVATRYLAREDASVLAVYGAGAQARTQIQAVCAVRPIREVRVVSRSGTSARALAAELANRRRGGADGGEAPFPTPKRKPFARAVDDPAAALKGADVVVAATDSSEPVFPGGAVEPGTHVNGIGSYTPEMREVDAELVRRATVVVDQREAALVEAGDLAGPLEEGIITPDHVKAELGEVVRGVRPGRTAPEEITFFKSVGNAVQDLAVAARTLRRAEQAGLGTVVEL